MTISRSCWQRIGKGDGVMRLQRFSNGQWLTLPATAEIARAGEGCLYTVSQAPPMVAKIYHHPSQARAQKLHVMLTHPPIDPMRQQGHPTFAWPVDLLLSDRGHVVGFLMPWVAGTRLIDVYHPKTRLQSFPWVNPRFLLRTARNLASMVEALHQRGYVVGDVNESNILVHTASQTSALSGTLRDHRSLAAFLDRLACPRLGGQRRRHRQHCPRLWGARYQALLLR